MVLMLPLKTLVPSWFVKLGNISVVLYGCGLVTSLVTVLWIEASIFVDRKTMSIWLVDTPN